MNNLIEQYKYGTQYGSAFSVFSLDKNAKNKHTYYLKIEAGKSKKHVGADLNLSYSAGSLIVGSGLIILMFSRTAQKNINKYLNKLKNHFEVRKEISSIEESKKKSKFYGFMVKKINSIIQKSESINNIVSLKDILFMKLMYKTRPTQKIHKKVSAIFENLSRDTVKKSYQKTEKSFTRMYKLFDNLDDYILKNAPDETANFKGREYTKKQLVEMAKGYRQTTKAIVSNFISNEAQQNRYEYIKEVNSTLYSKFWNASFKDFWTKNNKFKRKEMWQTFIAAEQIKGDKTQLAENIALVRNVVTYTKKDKAAMIHDYVNKLGELIPQKDDYGSDIVEKLEWFAKNSDGLKHNKEIFLKELENLSNHKIPSDFSSNIQQVRQESKNTYIRLIYELVNDDATGELQDMLAIYYKIAPFEMSKFGASVALKNAVKSFDKSVNAEIGEFFDKVRDLELGSAPTDILTMLISFGLILKGLNYASDKDEKVSTILKSGIPIVGALATSIISATKLISGGKSLALGFLSGLLLNQMGVMADKLRLKYKNNTKT